MIHSVSKNVKLIVMVLAIILVIASVAVFNYLETTFQHGDPSWNGKNKEDSIDRGRRIVGALERYRKEYGNYPQSLDELRPQYLDEIPMPTAGSGKWRYRAYGTVIQLQFAVGSGYPSINYYQPTGEWYEDR